MNPPEQSPLDLKVALANQAWNSLVKVLPPELLGSHNVPREALLPTEQLLGRLYSLIGEVQRAMARHIEGSGDPLLQLSPSHASFVRSVLVPHAEDIKRAFLLCDELGEVFRERMDLDNLKPNRAFDRALTFVAEYADRFDEDDIRGIHVEKAFELLNAPWFRPDAWSHNMSALRPLILGSDPAKIPARIRVRIQETHRTFIFGSWMATMAMCRSLVEFALIESAPRLGFKATQASQDTQERYLRLDSLISEAVEGHADLEEDLRLLQDSGNRILHPRKRQNVIPTPKILRSEALSSIKAATRVVEYLYANPARHDG